MRKKALIIVGAVLAVIAAVSALLLHGGADGMNAFERAEINRYLSAEASDTHEGMAVSAIMSAVEAGTDGYACTEFLGARNQIDYGTGYIHVRVGTGKDKRPVLSDGFADIDEDSVALSRVLEAFEAEGSARGLVLELSEYTALLYIDSFLVNSGYAGKTVVTGVYQTALETVCGQLPHMAVFCDYGDENTLTLEQIAELGAKGILCSGKAIDAGVFERAQQLGLRVWADCGDDIYLTVKAMQLAPEGVVTALPELVSALQSYWSDETLDTYLKEK